MSRLIERLSDTVAIDFGQFMVIDLDGANGQPEGTEGLFELADRASMTDWFLAGANAAIISSQAESWHSVDVTVERWDGLPPDDTDQWSRSETAEFYSSSGKLRLTGVHGHSSEKIIDLCEQARTWLVCASVRPGSGAHYPEEGLPEGLEAYRLRFWPASP
ncbi:hypothetical protein [Planomonospora venezuelensis]|uniref:Uncharacterized protein n=1 Tax=Planomonospora venezuelensis TaxID=1999 RepID=A0A841D423_PLAVE|nr:hypothetical protein [Planomonospora venezuelensis]MBB5964229.1 hypothetical protein [Planomonospora venezuelensis]GIN02544.1 hypothetical protein Pve01_42020 [Planomonospora venezuelensis]